MDKRILDLQDKGIVIVGISDEQSHFAMKKMCETQAISKKHNDRIKRDQDKWYLKRLGK